MLHDLRRGQDPSDLDLLGHIPANAARVIAMGRAARDLAAAFRRRQPDGEWWAVDPLPSSEDMRDADRTFHEVPERAGRVLRRALTKNGTADVLLLDDILQHLADPRAFLSEMLAFLAPGGTVVARLTNPAHWTVLRRTISGEGFAEPLRKAGAGGRALNMPGLVELLRASGLGGTKLSVRHDEKLSPRQHEIRTALAGVAEALGLVRTDLEQRLSEISYVATACKAPTPTMLNVHHVAFSGACLPARIDLPCTIMNSLPGVSATRSIAQHVVPNPRDGEAWVLVLQRQKVLDREAFFSTFGALARKGWLLVAEWDDDPDLLPDYVKHEWLANPWLSVSAVHGCQVSTPRLAELFGRHNPETVIFENALAEIPPRAQKTTDKVRIVYGALNREGVAELVKPAIDRVAERDKRVEVVIIHDRAVFDALDTPRKRFVPHLPYQDYLRLVESAHVALLPIVGREPELGKSDLKFIESASRGAAVVASPAIYASTIRDGETGFIANTPDEWTDRLEQLVADAELRERVAGAAWDYVARDRLISRQVARREAWYRSLWERRDELNRALFARHPEMAG
jgi:glycosyltransferase involved in cell wall biosynthesis